MEKINCLFCKTDQEDPILVQENGFSGRKCARCGLVYISPRPSLDDIKNMYSHDQAQIPSDTHTAQSFSKRMLARHHLAILRRYISSGKLLEIGAGGGYFLDEARKTGFEVFGLEWNTRQVEFIRNSLAIACESGMLNDAFEGTLFDTIYHCDVLSHFYDPFAEFLTIHKRLKTGGILFFETGNGDFQEKYLPAFSSFQYPDHLFFFSERNLRDLLAQTGFELLAFRRWSLLPQLVAKKAFFRLTKKPKKGGQDLSTRKATVIPAEQSARKPSPGKIIQTALDLLSFLLRYYVGAMLPKEKRPCTFILVARKVTGTSSPAKNDRRL
ncbi:MAG: class I SAM-dependent methyltransferase [Anaerolineales bacterium]|nr:class I SAM-dependent methyltransferase [Anaerolineales bacterium]